jgi:hypothetical protein
MTKFWQRVLRADHPWRWFALLLLLLGLVLVIAGVFFPFAYPAFVFLSTGVMVSLVTVAAVIWRSNLFSGLVRFQKLALAVSALGLITACLFAFVAGSFFGTRRRWKPPCVTVYAYRDNELLGSDAGCLDNKEYGFLVKLPPGATSALILDSQGKKHLQETRQAPPPPRLSPGPRHLQGAP